MDKDVILVNFHPIVCDAIIVKEYRVHFKLKQRTIPPLHTPQ